MLSVLIPYIDTQLTEFKKNYGLAELITEGGEDNAKTFPAVYINSGSYSNIDLEDQISYHRVDGDMSIVETDQNTVGCSHGLDITYPLVLVGCLPREYGCDQYALDTIANGIAFKLKQIRLSKAQKAAIKSWSVEIIIKSINTKRDEIWNREYRNVPMQANFDKAYFSISYEILIKADSSCLSLLDCSQPVVFPPSCDQIAIIPNEGLRCLTQDQIEYIASHFFATPAVNLATPVISGSLSYGSTLTGSQGQWLGVGLTYTYQWYRNGSAIIGATDITYQLGLSDTTDTIIAFGVMATNNYGSPQSISDPVVPTLLQATVSHYQRVIADSGTLADFSDLNTLFGNSHFANDLVCSFDPGVWGYKFNNPKVSKVYSTNANSDISQATTSIQPVLLNPSLGIFARVRTDNIETDITSQSPVYNSTGPQIVQCQLSPTNGARGVFLSAPPITSIGMEYQTAGNQLNWVCGGSGFSVPLGSFTPSDPFYVRGYYEPHPTYKIDVSNDGLNWQNVHGGTHAQASFTITRFGVGRGTLATNGPAHIYSSSVNRGVRTIAMDFDNFNPVANSRLWTNDFGLQLSIGAITTAEDIYPTQVVTELTCAFDGVTDKMQSGVIAFPASALTIYGIIDWGMIQPGTRYCIDDTGGNISIWTDSANVFVGDSVNFLNLGPKPSGVRMLTFVKNGANSLGQINQGIIVTGNAGSTMPTNIIVGGKTAVNTNNSTLTRSKFYAFNGADDLSTRTATQNLLNSIQNFPLF